MGNHEDLKKLHSRLVFVNKEFQSEDSLNPYQGMSNYIEFYANNYHRLLLTKKKDFSVSNDVYDQYGSKWFTCEFEVYEDNGIITSISLQGDSAWSPILPFVAKISKKFKLEAEGSFEEPGMDFAGEYTVDKNGNVSENTMTYKEYEAANNPEGYWNNLIDNIQEGHYETLKAIYNDLYLDGYELTEEDVKIIEDEFAKSKEANS
jgi:hypothetical protein